MSVLPLESDSIVQASADAVAALENLSGKPAARPNGEQDLAGISGAYTFADEIQRLHIWTCEHEVDDGSLDHKLREASSLKDQVLTLLSELSSKATTIVRPVVYNDELTSIPELTTQNSRSNSLPSTDARDGINESGITPHFENSVTPPIDLAFVVEDDQSVSSIDTSWTPESLVDTPLAQAHDIITHLMQLGPSLLDPVPHDRVDLSANSDATQHDVKHVRESFPKAEKSLVERLGTANWERRQFLRKLRDEREQRRPSDDAAGRDGLEHPKVSETAISVVDTAPDASGVHQNENNKDPDASLGTIEMQISDENESGSDLSPPGSLRKSVSTRDPSDPQTSLHGTRSTTVTEPSNIGAAQIQQVRPSQKELRVSKCTLHEPFSKPSVATRLRRKSLCLLHRDG